MARIFISYSRRNIEFARRLAAAFEKHDLEFWMDLEDIQPAEEWREKIQKGIEEADTFLFIVSPASVTSKICLDELDVAVQNGKRLIPVVPIEIQWDDAPPALAKLNYIFFRETDDFEAAFEKLLVALNTDYEWTQTHRRLQVKALEWERGHRDSGFLLRGRDLEQAEVEISTHATKDPLPTDLQREYVLKSRQSTDRQRRVTTGVLVFIILMLVGISAYLVTPIIQEAAAKDQARGELVTILEGAVRFGTDDPLALASGATPLQDIFVPSFQIGKYEVTNRQYKLCVTHGPCTVPLEQTDYKAGDKQEFPVVYVTLFQASTYCRWVGQRLLTEVEWERAARGPDNVPWPWGMRLPAPDFVNMPALDTGLPTLGPQAANSNLNAASVPQGIYNLVGNVWEWTSSFYYLGGPYDPASYWDGTPDSFSGTSFYSTRGGGWANKIDYLSQSNPNTGTDVRDDLGIRCGVDLK